MLQASPVVTEMALVPYIHSKPPMDPVASNSIEFVEVTKLRQEALLDYTLNLQQYLINWCKENKKQAQDIIQEVKFQAQETAQRLSQELPEKNTTIMELQENLLKVKEVTDNIALEKRMKEEAKLLRQARQRKPLRDMAEYEELNMALPIVIRVKDNIFYLSIYTFSYA